MLLDSATITNRLDQLDGWALDGKTITKQYKFGDFAEAIGFVNHVAEKAEAAAHHPDIDIRWNLVTLSLSTHSKGGLTDKDFDLADNIDQPR